MKMIRKVGDSGNKKKGYHQYNLSIPMTLAYAMDIKAGDSMQVKVINGWLSFKKVERKNEK